ncbi:MAG: hypothetical protein A2V81_01655 [Candidatus Abawacabacteria bacterium RBG_16_42_10]|uniref:Uncharacterized protein n=1 Tax=Candidatus Abawacabacteria bacterium RBG_16_42_10 TaxID=1817814 RepID=A0A1F4XJM3_9BACT|nr:MAG: hypothetical protein A2V81_01655 [Candidatus Abawacabacteria bacterium RBG_16_42_10]
MSILKNRRLEALKKTILLSATIHLILLITFSIVKLDAIYINYFNMLDLELLFPDIIKGPVSQIVSAVLMVTIYFIFYFRFTKNK